MDHENPNQFRLWNPATKAMEYPQVGRRQFLIGLDGTPDKIEIPDRKDCSQEFVACFTSVVSLMRFPKPRGGEPIEVFYPFVFSPI